MGMLAPYFASDSIGEMLPQRLTVAWNKLGLID